jgi:hypothetical protein
MAGRTEEPSDCPELLKVSTDGSSYGQAKDNKKVAGCGVFFGKDHEK